MKDGNEKHKSTKHKITKMRKIHVFLPRQIFLAVGKDARGRGISVSELVRKMLMEMYDEQGGILAEYDV